MTIEIKISDEYTDSTHVFGIVQPRTDGLDSSGHSEGYADSEGNRSIHRESYTKQGAIDWLTAALEDGIREDAFYIVASPKPNWQLAEAGSRADAAVAVAASNDPFFIFPDPNIKCGVNESIFATNWGAGGRSWEPEFRLMQSELKLRESERAALERARSGVQGWINAGTISPSRGEGTLKRIDFLLSGNRIANLYDYHEEEQQRLFEPRI